jgi:hypothetical protein
MLAGHLGWSRSDRVLDLGAGPVGIDNLSFVIGGSDDLAALSPA